MDLPLINAGLNFLSSVFLVTGFLAIKQGKKQKHKKLMISAFITSAIFLTCYLYYHFTQGHIKFEGTGAIKFVYLLILIPHIILAMVMLPMIFATFYYAFKEKFDSHRRLAKITFPIWLYVSITGVLLYIYIYILFPFYG